MKRCSKCREIKHESRFCKDNRTKDKLVGWCSECHKKVSKEWRINNKIKVYLNRKKYRLRPEYFKKQNENQRKYIKQLDNWYIKALLQDRFKLSFPQINQELVEMKREQLMAHRVYLKIRKEINNEKRIYGSIRC